MANSYFKFKQFTVNQQYCAMKVCTDACVFGAYAATHLKNRHDPANHILDIGSGTGLLALMVAQKTIGTIDAVEIDEAAFAQAKENFNQSPWATRLHIFNADVTSFYNSKKYDCIICNPPFFEGDLKSADNKKNAAKHDTALTLEQLLAAIKNLLAPQGSFAVLLPWQRVDFFIKLATSAGYFLTEQVSLQHTEAHPYFRGILIFSHNQGVATIKSLAIKIAAGNYTDKFTALLKDYYLNL